MKFWTGIWTQSQSNFELRKLELEISAIVKAETLPICDNWWIRSFTNSIFNPLIDESRRTAINVAFDNKIKNDSSQKIMWIVDSVKVRLVFICETLANVGLRQILRIRKGKRFEKSDDRTNKTTLTLEHFSSKYVAWFLKTFAVLQIQRTSNSLNLHLEHFIGVPGFCFSQKKYLR